MTNNLDIKSFQSPKKLYSFILNFFNTVLNKEKGTKIIALPGGTTPIHLYKLLSVEDYDWSDVKLLLTDERLVSLDSKYSNTKVISKNFSLNILNQSAFKVYPNMLSYKPGLEKEILDDLNKNFSNFPKISISVLGVGNDGHTASIFPDLNALSNLDDPFFLTKRKNEDFLRVSLSEKFILSSEIILLLILGEKKKEVLSKLGSKDLSLPVNRIIENSKNKVICVTDILNEDN